MGSDARTAWDEALHSLTEEDRAPFQNVETLGKSQRQLLDDVLQATLEKKEECIKKRWKITVRKRTIILHDLLGKMSSCTSTLIAVGDTAMQADAGHAALPWAVVRTILKATILEEELSRAILEGVETAVNTLARCAFMERLYAQRYGSSHTRRL
jgi:hypothetical protein